MTWKTSLACGSALLLLVAASAHAQSFTSNVTIATGDTPLVRLAQTGESGFAPQIWDVAGNEDNFFVRDVSNDNRLPLRIRPGAPTSSIDISADGNVGIGDDDPQAKLHVFGSDDAQVLVEREGPGAAVLFKLHNKNDGNVRFEMVKGSTSWTFNNTGNAFTIAKAGTGVAQLQVDSQGNTTVLGSMTAAAYFVPSARELKTDIEPVDGRAVLEKVARLPIYAWRYKTDRSDTRYVGPMAEDFHESFALGSDADHVSLVTESGLSLAALQGLHQTVIERTDDLDARLREKDERIAMLERANQTLEERLVALEERMRGDR